MYRIARFFVFFLGVLGITLLLSVGIQIATAQALTPIAPVSLDALGTRDLQIDLGDGWTTQAQFTWPKTGRAPFSTVILFPPGGPNDMDATQQYSSDGPIVALNFRVIAQQLGMKGIAVLRFNKRGVRTATDFDNDQVGKSAPRGREVADGESVLAAALEQPEVDAKRVYLFAWSDGTLTVSQLAVFHPELAGLILQGAPNDPSFKELITYQTLEETVGYLTDTIDTSKDGKVSADELKAVPAIGVAAWNSQQLYDSSSTPAHPVLSKSIDTNGDGLIDIQKEVVPFFQSQIDSMVSSTPDRNVPTTADTLARLQVPVLLLAGGNDGAVPNSDSQAIAQALGSRATLKIYPGLGHGLDPVNNPALDDFGAIGQQPIDDMIAWILAAK